MVIAEVTELLGDGAWTVAEPLSVPPLPFAHLCSCSFRAGVPAPGPRRQFRAQRALPALRCVQAAAAPRVVNETLN